MNISKHAGHRMSQRGITREMIDICVQFGAVKGNRYVLGRNDARRLAAAYRIIMKILDKGGVEVAVEDSTIVTTFSRH
jgi:hypothetical protein